MRKVREVLRGWRGLLALAAYGAVFVALGPAQSALGMHSVWPVVLRAVTVFLAGVVGLVVYARLGRPTHR